MKYVMMVTDEGRKIPILFPDCLTHFDVAKWAQPMIASSIATFAIAESAGFVSVRDVNAHGESESLAMKSKDSDSAYIELGDAVSWMPEESVMPLLEMARKKDKTPK